jgi:hypothetical protein
VSAPHGVGDRCESLCSPVSVESHGTEKDAQAQQQSENTSFAVHVDAADGDVKFEIPVPCRAAQRERAVDERHSVDGGTDVMAVNASWSVPHVTRGRDFVHEMLTSSCAESAEIER